MYAQKAEYLLNVSAKRTRMVLCLLLGVLLGSLFINLFMSGTVQNNLSVYSLEQLLKTQTSLNASELFVYLIGRRGLQLLLIVGLLLLLPPGLSRILLLLTLGTVLGAVVSMQVICAGMRGVFSFLLVLFPQAICYLGGVLYALCTWRKRNPFTVLLILTGCFLLGVILESFVNSRLLAVFTNAGGAFLISSACS